MERGNKYGALQKMTQNNKRNYFKRLSQGAEAEIFELARQRRQNQTVAEIILWDSLRNKKLKGFKFRRQHPILRYIADFYCPSKKLVIELDGKYHEVIDQAIIDRERTAAISESGIKVMRFSNKEIFENVEKVLGSILDELNNL